MCDLRKINSSKQAFLGDGYRITIELCWNYRDVLRLWFGSLNVLRIPRWGGKIRKSWGERGLKSDIFFHFFESMVLSHFYSLKCLCSVMWWSFRNLLFISCCFTTRISSGSLEFAGASCNQRAKVSQNHWPDLDCATLHAPSPTDICQH